MLARRVIDQTEDGVTSVDYIKADVARAPKRNWRGQFAPAQEVSLRDGLWQELAARGLKPHEIAITCARAARSPRNIQRRLRQLEAEDRRSCSEAG